MSGTQTSERIPVRVRALLAVLMALAMLIPAIGAYAASPAQEVPGPQPVGNDKFCINGSIINFNETIDFGQDEFGNDIGAAGWGITATQIDPAGGQALTTLTDDDGKFSFDGLTAGRWQIAITLKPDFQMVPPYEQSFIVDLKYGMHDCANVRFKMRRPVPVNVCKIDDNHRPLSGWIMRAEPAPGNWFASPVEIETPDDGCAKFSLTEGDWIFKERAPDGQAYTPVIPTNGQQRLTVKWQGAGVPLVIRFKNRLAFQGCINVSKVDVPPPGTGAAFGLPGWKIYLKRTNGTLVASGTTDAQGNITFGHLPFGPYIVEEEQRVGWAPASSTGFTVIVNQPAGDDNENCQQVDFQNRQNPAFCITGRKIDTNGKIGLPGWVITATAVYKGGYPNEDIDGFSALTTTTDGTGVYQFNFPRDDYRIPGAAYRVCEEQRDGWLPHTPYCQTVYLPKTVGACAKAWDFENQQVGHWESVIYGNGGSSSGSGSCSSTHTVVAGESLFGIGASYGVSGSAMLAANPWVYNRPNHYVYPGDSVCIP